MLGATLTCCVALLSFSDRAASAKETGSAMPDGDYKPVPIPVSLQPEIKRAERIGLELYLHATALEIAKSVVRTDAPDFANQNILGLIPLRGKGPQRGPIPSFVVAVYTSEATPRVKYEVHIDPGVAAHLETFEPPKPAAAALLKLVRAREVARAAMPRGRQPVNVVVLPGAVGGEPGTLVYALALAAKANTVVLGKHFRVMVPERGPASVTPLSDAELELSSVAADGSKPETWPVTHAGGPCPNEGHVFAAMTSDSHLVVTTSAGLWSVGQHIQLLRRVPPGVGP